MLRVHKPPSPDKLKRVDVKTSQNANPSNFSGGCLASLFRAGQTHLRRIRQTVVATIFRRQKEKVNSQPHAKHSILEVAFDETEMDMLLGENHSVFKGWIWVFGLWVLGQSGFQIYSVLD